MAIKKKKKIKKKSARKTIKRKTRSLPKVKKRKKKGSKGRPENQDVIFDSQLGKTDALFVANPEPKSDPAIGEALNEFNDLEKTAEPSQSPLSSPPQPPPLTQVAKKKSFWQKIFNRK